MEKPSTYKPMNVLKTMVFLRNFMKFKKVWCLKNKLNIFYCRPYKSKKGALYNLRLKLRQNPKSKWNKNFYIEITPVYNPFDE